MTDHEKFELIEGTLILLLEEREDALRPKIAAMLVDVGTPGFTTPSKAARQIGVSASTITRALERLKRKQHAKQKMQCLTAQSREIEVLHTKGKSKISGVVGQQGVS